MAHYYPQARINISAVFDGFGGPDAPVVFDDILPQSFSVHCNSYKEADTWEVSFNSRFFPFSPELLRSAAVEIYVYQAPDATSPFVYQEENLLVTGLVDTGTLSQGREGGVVSLEGRDYTALLLDRQWDPTESGHKGRIPSGLPLDEVVQKLVDEAVQADTIGRTLTVEFHDGEVSPITGRLDPILTKKKVTQKPVTGSGRSSKKKKGIVVKADQSYWDTIYKLCMSYGFIVYVKGFKVIITKPHVLQAEAQDKIHRVAYGRNLETLESERGLAKESVPQIRVRSFDPKTKTAIEGRFPEGRDLVTTGVGTKREEYKVMTVPGVTDERTLKEIARTAYHTIARGEGKVRFTTKHLKDLPDPLGIQRDFLQLRSGDPVRIEWDAFNEEALANEKDFARRVAGLIALGYSFDVANTVADHFERLSFFRQPFYVKEINYTWSSDQGMGLDVEAMNFINVQRDGVTDGV